MNFFSLQATAVDRCVAEGAWCKICFGIRHIFFSKNTSNLILLSFKVPSEIFFHKNFKTGLTFWNMWFWKIENWVESCQHISEPFCTWNTDNSWPEINRKWKCSKKYLFCFLLNNTEVINFFYSTGQRHQWCTLL